MASERECHACGSTFIPKRVDQKHCNKRCGLDAANLEMLRARALYRELYHYFLSDTKQGQAQQVALAGLPDFKYKGNMGVISRAARHWIAEDRTKGRRPPPFPVGMDDARWKQQWTANSARNAKGD